MNLRFLLCVAVFGPVMGFAPLPRTHSVTTNAKGQLSALPPIWQNDNDQEMPVESIRSTAAKVSNPTAMTGLATGLLTFASVAFAGEEMEMAELPPPWVPAIFAVVLLVGVGVLTGSLGNVIDEEAQLGLQSGARARKEIDRSKSSYFKKR